MANLANCLITQYGPVNENVGDTVWQSGSPVGVFNVPSILEPQSFFGNTGSSSSVDSAFPMPLSVSAYVFGGDADNFGNPAEGRGGLYFLVISAQPGYHITSDMLTIASQDPVTIENEEGFPNGVREWDDISTTLPQYVQKVITWDNGGGYWDSGSENGENWWKCNNEVIAMVILDENFEMPSNDIVIKIDFDGDAVACDPIDPNTESETQQNVYWGMQTAFILTNASQIINQTGLNPWIAKYYQDGYDNSYPQVFKFNRRIGIEWEGINNSCNIPVEPNDWYTIAQSSGLTTCLGNSQPTCYSVLVNDSSHFLDDEGEPSSEYPNTYATLQGRIMLPVQTGGGIRNYQGGEAFQYSDDWWLANSTEDSTAFGSWGVGTGSLRSEYRVYHYVNNSCDDWSLLPHLDIEQHPALYPGDGIAIPAKEIFRIKLVGDTQENWELVADSTLVDVWGAVTVIKKVDGNDVSPVIQEPLGPQYSIDTNNVTYAEYTAANNECDMDLSKTEITSCGDRCVEVAVYYNTAVNWVRGTNSNTGSKSDFRYNKVFINIYPTEIE